MRSFVVGLEAVNSGIDSTYLMYSKFMAANHGE